MVYLLVRRKPIFNPKSEIDWTFYENELAYCNNCEWRIIFYLLGMWRKRENRWIEQRAVATCIPTLSIFICCGRGDCLFVFPRTEEQEETKRMWLWFWFRSPFGVCSLRVMGECLKKKHHPDDENHQWNSVFESGKTVLLKTAFKEEGKCNFPVLWTHAYIVANV